MVIYFIGDVYGCYDELIVLLYKVEFIFGKDIFWLMGDLVVCGLGLLDVLCYVKFLGDSVCLVLGNYDLYLLVVFVGISCNKLKDCLILLLEVLDVDELFNWLRC